MTWKHLISKIAAKHSCKAKILNAYGQCTCTVTMPSGSSYVMYGAKDDSSQLAYDVIKSILENHVSGYKMFAYCKMDTPEEFIMNLSLSRYSLLDRNQE